MARSGVAGTAGAADGVDASLEVSEFEVERLLSSSPEELARLVETANDAHAHPRERSEAGRLLAVMSRDMRFLPPLHAIIGTSQHERLVFHAVSSVTSLLLRHLTSFPDKDRRQIQTYFLEYMQQNGPALTPALRNRVSELLAVVTKTCWFEEGGEEQEASRSIVPRALAMLEMSYGQGLVAMNILRTLVEKMNVRDAAFSATLHRKVVVSFRDTSLRACVDVGFSVLFAYLSGKLTPDGDDDDGGGGGGGGGRGARAASSSDARVFASSLMRETLGLLQACFSYDFIGSQSDATVDDMSSTVQIPSAWRARLLHPACLRLLFAAYRAFVVGRVPFDADAPDLFLDPDMDVRLDPLLLLPPPAGGGAAAAAGGGGGGGGGDLGAPGMRFMWNADAEAGRPSALLRRETDDSAFGAGDPSSPGDWGVAASGSATSSSFPTAQAGGKKGVEPLVEINAGCFQLARGELEPGMGRARTCVQDLERANDVLQVLVLLAGTRRSLFERDAERRAFLTAFVHGTWAIMDTKLGIRDDPTTFTSLCQLLGRLKANFQLTELMRVPGYGEWVQQLSQTTTDAFVPDAIDAVSMNGIPYLLSLWSRMVAALPYVRSEAPLPPGSASNAAMLAGRREARLDDLVPELISCYVRSRLERCALLADRPDEFLDELLPEHTDHAVAEVESMVGLCRHDLPGFASEVCLKFGQLRDRRRLVQMRMSQPGPRDAGDWARELVLLDMQLSWLLYLVGAVTSAQHFSTPNPDSESLAAADREMEADARMLRAALDAVNQVVEATAHLMRDLAHLGDGADRRDPCDVRLMCAVLYFVRCFRVTFMTEQNGMPPPEALGVAHTVERLLASGSSASVLLRVGASLSATAAGVAGSAAAGGGGGVGGGALSASASASAALPDLEGFSLARSREAGTLADLRSARAIRERAARAQAKVSLTPRQQRYMRFFEQVGHGHVAIFTQLVDTLCMTLRLWTDDAVVERALDVLQELANVQASSRLAVEQEGVKDVLRMHGPRAFRFLANPLLRRKRLVFYASLARLVFMMDDPDETFDLFVAPLLGRRVLPGAAGGGVGGGGAGGLGARADLEDTALGAVLAVVRDRVVSAEAGEVLEGFARDVRGVVTASQARKSFGLVFDALYPQALEALAHALSLWGSQPCVVDPSRTLYTPSTVTNAILKLFCELALNRMSRIAFAPTSPNGILLFRAISTAVQNYAAAALDRDPAHVPPGADVYKERFKGVAVALTTLARALEGGFCPFGVFALFGDSSLDAALNAGIALVQALSPDDVLAYEKLARAYLHFVGVLARAHTAKLVDSLDQASFKSAVDVLRRALHLENLYDVTHAALAVDALASAFARGRSHPRERLPELEARIEGYRTVFEEISNELFDAVAFSDVANHVTLSRPLLSCIVAAGCVHEGAWAALKDRIVAAQPRDLAPRLVADFDQLEDGLTQSLDAANRERFAQRITVFGLHVREYVQL